MACLGIEVFCHFVLHLGYPYDWPLTPHGETVFDLNNYVRKYRAFHSPAFYQIEAWNPFAYPAPMALVYRVVYWIPVHRGAIFTLFTLSCFVVAAASAGRAAMRRGLRGGAAVALIGTTMALSYPLAFEIKQGNLEIVVWILLSGGTALFLRGRDYSAALCFALAGSLKIFPLIFLGLLLSRGRWRPVLVALVAAGLVTLAALWLVDPDVVASQHQISAGMATFQQKIVLQIVRREIGFDHSLFSVLKRVYSGMVPGVVLAPLLRGYLVTAALTGTLLYVFRIRFLPVVNQVLCLTLAAILLPPVSYDYTLIHLYIPLTLFALLAIEAARTGRRIPALPAVLSLLAVSVAPLAEFIVHGLSIAGQVRAPFLLTLFVLGLIFPFASAFDEPSPAGNSGTSTPAALA